MWALIGTYDYVFHADDINFLSNNWMKYLKAVNYILDKVDPDTGLMMVTGPRDWARTLKQGQSSEANMLLYRTLITASKLADWIGNPSESQRFSGYASNLRTSIQNQLYSNESRLYIDSPQNPSLYPQDSNALSVHFNIATWQQKYDISHALLQNWGPYGPSAPELPTNISPFITSLELDAHFSIGQTFRALDLLRRTWGFYLNHPNGTQSTMIEGFRSDGTFGYRGGEGYKNDSSLVSHSHSWSTGPTYSLTKYVAGLSILTRSGMEWQYRPQFGNLKFAEAGFVTKLGKFRSQWAINAGQIAGSTNGYNVTLETPERTKGHVYLPALRKATMIVTVNNATIEVEDDGVSVQFQLGGGMFNITVRSADLVRSI
jgi:hypothetical protein